MAINYGHETYGSVNAPAWFSSAHPYAS